jgi:hypothetical protein
MTTLRCPYCGVEATPIVVHGHSQCARCGTNIEPCCSGASASDEAAVAGDIQGGLDPDLFRRTFVQLGGTTATVTRASLQFALAQRLGVDLDSAQLVIEAGVRLLALVPVRGDGYRLRSS